LRYSVIFSLVAWILLFQSIQTKKLEPPEATVCNLLQLNGSQIQEVCKKYFINTFGVSEKYCSTAWKTRDLLSGTPISEQRGHHGNHKKIDEDLKMI
jgi:hypothetical protein